MNDLNSSDYVKIAFGIFLMGVWIAMLVMKVGDADDIIAFCKLGLTGLATHYLTNYGTAPAPGSTTITTTPVKTATPETVALVPSTNGVVQ